MRQELLVVVFGHTNTADGRLSAIAQSRARAAMAILEENPTAVLLPTGAFGQNFNESARRHSSILRDYLIACGAPPEQVLAGTDSSNTVEDCLCIRRLALDEGFSRLLLVTSEFHISRVRFIAERVLWPLQLEYRGAGTPDALVSVAESREEESFDRVKRELAVPALYVPKQQFPDAIYEAASADHRHYDTVSLASVTAMIVVGAFPLTLAGGLPVPVQTAGLHLAAALLVFILGNVYERTAQTARMARRVMRNLEVGWDLRGFSTAYDQAAMFGQGPWWKRLLPVSIRSAAILSGVLLAVGNLSLAALNLLK